MDLAPIGAHCSLPSCRALDLLPIRCRCDQQFCKEHIFPDTHDCPVDPSQALRDASSHALQKLRRCSFASCNKPSLDAFVGDSAGDEGRISALCARCKLGYCAARSLLYSAKHFPNAGAASSNRATTSTRKIPTDPKKLAQLQQVELMRMRHRAVPADPKDKPGSVGVDQRLHVKASYRGDREGVEKTFWFRKSVGTGKALDLLARHFNVRNTGPLLLYRRDMTNQGELVLLETDRLLREQTEDGCELVLSSD
ncbi:hypothetical protein EDB87DRAFT_1687078 [Lactarius vividus]|nr:hypothetical protein EDB87DRAFT_1687078 [Lactarius vividus]